MKTAILHKYRHIHRTRSFYLRLITSLALFTVSLVINYCANNYTALHASNPVNDLLLDNIPTLNVAFIYFWGPIMLVIFILLLTLHSPNKVLFILKSVALIILVRSFFMILTHIGAPINRSEIPDNTLLEKLFAGSGDDLFFSGHTAFPFLMALLYWKEKYIRYTFLAITILLATVVIIAHVHYSIDVFSAFFITYGTLHISMFLFKKDYQLFLEPIPPLES